jgi:hypothetical protein
MMVGWIEPPTCVWLIEATLPSGVSMSTAAGSFGPDADHFAEAIGAEVVSRHPGWATQRTFHLDSELCEEISSALKGAK